MAGLRVLLTGATGFLGWNIARVLSAEGYRLTGTRHRSGPSHAACDTWIPLALEAPAPLRTIDMRAFDAVIHCAAIARADVASAEPDRARLVNVEGTRRLADAAADAGATFFFISTDLVFDGTRAPYREEDAPSPAGVYGETKASAEIAVRAAGQRAYILRTALMFGAAAAGPGSFLSWLIPDLRAGRPVRLYENQFRNVLYAPDVGRAIHALLRSRAAAGTYHLGGPERLSRFDIGAAAARILLGTTRGIERTQLARAAFPGIEDDTTLDTAKIRGATGMDFMYLEEGLKELRGKFSHFFDLTPTLHNPKDS